MPTKKRSTTTKVAAKSAPKKPSTQTDKAKARDRRLRQIFNITQEEYLKVLEYQGGGCAITGRLFRKDGRPLLLAVDHCHLSGRTRGILENSVNKGLAYFNDDPHLLRRAADYLENHPVQMALNETVYGVIGKSTKKAASRRYGPRTTENPKGTKEPQPRAALKKEK